MVLRLTARALAISAILSPLLLSVTQGFYLPGVAPTEYKRGDDVKLMVNALTPGYGRGTVKSVIPYDYYDKNFNFCEPEVEKAQAESLGSILFGDRIWTSPFQVIIILMR